MEFAPSMRGDGHGMQHMKPIGTPGRTNHQQGHGSTTMLADAGYGPPASGNKKYKIPPKIFHKSNQSAYS